MTQKKQKPAIAKAPLVAPSVWLNRIVGYGEEAPDQLLANDKNWRVHPKAQQEALMGTLRKVGIVQNVIVNQRNGKMIDGHLRVEMAISENQPSVPITYVDLSDAEEGLILASLDSIGALAGTDQALLDSLITDIRLSDLGMDLGPGLDDLLNSLSPDPALAVVEGEDEVPALPSEPVSRLGDMWLLGGEVACTQCGTVTGADGPCSKCGVAPDGESVQHRVLCGDATSAEAVARLLSPTSGLQQPFLMLTDPPYGVSYSPEWRAEHDGGLRHATGKVANDDRVDWSPAFALFPGSVAYVWHAGVYAAEVATGINATGFKIRGQIIWRKQHFVFSRGAYHWQHEPCWYAVRNGQSAHWRGDRTQSTVWDVPNANPHGGEGQAEQTGHGTQKPVELMRRPILNHTIKGEAVYDCFLGSGSTLIAAELTGRVCYGLEIEPGYVDVICQRWISITGKQPILDGDGRTFEVIQAERLVGG